VINSFIFEILLYWVKPDAERVVNRAARAGDFAESAVLGARVRRRAGSQFQLLWSFSTHFHSPQSKRSNNGTDADGNRMLTINGLKTKHLRKSLCNLYGR